MAPAKMDERSDQDSMVVRLVGKYMFSKKQEQGHFKRLLVLNVVDVKTGKGGEIVAWGWPKSICVYRKAHEGSLYSISNIDQRYFRKVNEKYSNCDWLYAGYRWFLEPYESNYIHSQPELKLCSDVEKLAKRFKIENVVNIYARFEKLSEPVAFKGRSIIARYATLYDSHGRTFKCLFWQNTNYDKNSKYALLHCQPGDVILILQARLGGDTSGDMLHVTTLYHPVVEPKFI